MEQHLSPELISRYVDGELTTAASAECARHLTTCSECSRAYDQWQDFTLALDAALQTAPLPALGGLRERIVRAIEMDGKAASLVHQPGRVMQRFGWAMGIAAILAFAVVLAPFRSNDHSVVSVREHVSPSALIEIDGESFVPLPYSNSALSTASPHILQMHVPVASLAEAGIFLEPAAYRLDPADSVLANVLVGADGQPRGVHVLNAD